MFKNILYEEILCPSELGIILSYQCNAECKHCLYACGRKWTEWMKIEQLERLLEILLRWKHKFQIHLTGGEPFMNFPLLLSAVKLISKTGIYQFVETNASWCTSEKRAYDLLSELFNAGLNGIMISCSPFQSESIPLRRVLTAIKMAIDIFGYRNVAVYQYHCIEEIKEFSVDEPVPIESYIVRYGRETAGRMFWDVYGLIGSGRASYTLGELTMKFPASFFQRRNCGRELLYAHHSHVDLYGNYISWFCGGLRMGSWEGFEEMVDNFKRGEFPKLVGILIKDGPFGLYEFASKEFGYNALEDGYVSKCHLCVDVRKYLNKVADFEELSPRKFYDFIDPSEVSSRVSDEAL